MRITHLTSVHPRYDTRIFVKMCGSLAQEGFDTHLVVADGLGDETNNEVQIHDAGKASGNRILRMLKGTWSVYKRAKQLKADVYHFHDPELMIIGMLLKMSGNKVVFDVHEDLPRQILRKAWIPKVLRKPISFVAHSFEYLTAKVVDAVVTVTPTIAKRFAFTQVIEARNYASLDEFSGITIDPDNKHRVTYIGGITKDRGILPMVGAFSELDAKFTLAGKFQEKGLQQASESLPGWQNTEFLGWQSREQVTGLLEQTRVGLVVLQPTGDYEDAFPVKLFEYMASGAAVVASDFPLWREIVDSADCGICVDPTEPEQIAEAIDVLLKDKEKATAMGERGRAAVFEKYHWQSEAAKLIELYHQITKTK